MEAVYEKSKLLIGANKYCPGCGHGIVNKLIAQVLEENGWVGKTVECVCIGCAINMSPYVDWDMVQCPHGRASAVATGVRRVNKNALVFTYQGDGDAAGIGLAETFHAAVRGEGFTQIVVNNQIYGMTGGQTSCTTLVGQKTTTSGPNGRDPEKTGYPVRLAEMIAMADATDYVVRTSVHTPNNILKTKAAIEKAFRLQMEEGKHSFIEILSMCPTNTHIASDKYPDYMEENILPVFPLGTFRDVTEEAK